MTNEQVPAVQVSVLGHFEVRCAGELVIDAAWPRRKAQALIKLLAVQETRSLHRERVFEELWPRLSAEGAANGLRQCLHQLRAKLPHGTPDLVTLSGPSVSLREGIELDTDAFMSAAAQARGDGTNTGRYEDALAVYRGDLLADDLYEEWSEPLRQQLRKLRDQLLLEVSALYEDRTELDAAIQRLEQLLLVEPSREEAHRRLMRMYASLGQRDRAIRQYQTCREQVRRELDVDPSPETEELYRQIVEGSGFANGTVRKQDARESSAGAHPPQAAARPDRRRRPLTRSSIGVAVVLAGILIGGGTFVAIRHDGSAASIQHLEYKHSGTAVGTLVGDCISEDAHGHADYTGSVTGGITGTITGQGEGTYRVDTQCKEGIVHLTLELIDQDANKLFLGEDSEPISEFSQGPGNSLEAVINLRGVTDTVLGGTGRYESATGEGKCDATITTSFVPGATTFNSDWEYSCSLDVHLSHDDAAKERTALSPGPAIDESA